MTAALVAATAGLTACEGGVSSPEGESGLVLTVTAAQVSATSGRLLVEGPVNRTVTLSPGDQREIDLPAGTYSVALEGLNATTVVGFWERGGVTVREGSQTSLTVSLAPFAVNAPSAAATATPGEPITVTWSGVGGAASYDVQASASPDFTSVLDQQNVSGTSTQFTLSQSGTVFFRVRPRTRFGGAGGFSDASTGTDVRAAPTVDFYDVVFRPVSQGCGAFQDFRTDEAIGYSDGDGDMDPGRTFLEPAGGTPVGIESEWREEGDADWSPFGYDKGWTPDTGASGSGGGLSANGATCWSLDPDDPPTFVDFRVRVQDAAGNWSDWFETRLNMPQSVVVTPTGDGSVFLMDLGDAQTFTAEVRDGNGDLVPGDPVNWSSYVGAPHATIDATGTFVVDAASDGGLDWVVARAAYAAGVTGVQAGFTAGSWFSPSWTSPGLARDQGQNLGFRVRVYEGREYVISTTADGSGNSTGDVDIYVRFGQAPSTTAADASSVSAGLDDSVTWTAPADGVLFVLLDAFTSYTGVQFTVSGDQLPPRSGQAFPTPRAGPSGSMRLLTDEEAARSVPMLLAPRSLDRPVIGIAGWGR